MLASEITQDTLIDLSDNTHSKSRRICYRDILTDVTDIPVDAQFNIDRQDNRERFCVADIDYSFRFKAQNIDIQSIDYTNLLDGVSILTVVITKNDVDTTYTFTFVSGSPASDEIQIGADDNGTASNIKDVIDALTDIAATVATDTVNVTSNYKLSITTNQSDALTITDNTSSGTTPVAKLQLLFKNGNHNVYTEETPITLPIGTKSVKLDTKGRAFAIRVIEMTNAAIDWLDCEVGGWKTLGR